MKFKVLAIIIMILLITVAGCFLFTPALKGVGTDKTKRYEQDLSWRGSDQKLGNPTGLGVNSSNEIVIFHRSDRTWPLVGELPTTPIDSDVVTYLDGKTGEKIRFWGKGMFVMPHGLTIDGNNNVWLTDVGLHQIFQFDPYGRLLMTLGTAGKPGKGKYEFNMPTDVAFGKDGSFYVTDGYGNSRIVKFSSKGEYLFEWGAYGDKEGEFNIPHGIAIDEQGNVLVADRENRRIQKFDTNGKFLSAWTDKSFGYMCSVAYDSSTKKAVAVDDHRVVTRHLGSDLFIFRTDGIVESRFGRSGDYEGPSTWYHDIVADKDGNLYVGDIKNNKVHKFKKLPL